MITHYALAASRLPTWPLRDAGTRSPDYHVLVYRTSSSVTTRSPVTSEPDNPCNGPMKEIDEKWHVLVLMPRGTMSVDENRCQRKDSTTCQRQLRHNTSRFSFPMVDWRQGSGSCPVSAYHVQMVQLIPTLALNTFHTSIRIAQTHSWL